MTLLCLTLQWAFNGAHAGYHTLAKDQRVLILQPAAFAGWLECSVDRVRALVPAPYVELMARDKSFVPLVQLIVGADESLTRSLGLIVKPTAADRVAKALLQLYTDNAQELRLMRFAVESEVTDIGFLNGRCCNFVPFLTCISRCCWRRQLRVCCFGATASTRPC